MKKKSRLEILRAKLKRMGESDEIHGEMPDDVAEAFLAELRFDPDTGAIAARAWRPDNRNEEPWIKEFLDSQPRAVAKAKTTARPILRAGADDGEVN